MRAIGSDARGLAPRSKDLSTADRAVIHAMAIKVDHVIRLAGASGVVEFFAQGRQRRRTRGGPEGSAVDL
jgi:hypothetical protein